LFDWAKRAKINKHVTFHCSRHTFAVMMLGVTDIYTVSKLLGHRELSTTQVYAHVIDKAKREAIDNIPDVIN
jgi:site-specific recombinase XerD